MKKFFIVRKFTVALCLLICAAIIACWADRRWGSYRLKFVDSATKQPIPGTTFLLVPINILSNFVPGQPVEDPNLKFAKSITTDLNGYATLGKRLIDDLTANGRINVDCRSQDYAGFCLRRNALSAFLCYERITVFHSSGIVSHHVSLGRFHDNLLLLEKSSIPPASSTGKSVIAPHLIEQIMDANLPFAPQPPSNATQ